jgi:hypothetical protein
MGISPIANLTALTPDRRIESDLEPLPMARVENSERTGDETYSPSKGKSSRGSEDDGSEDDFDDLPDEIEIEATAPPAENNPARQISFFA